MRQTLERAADICLPTTLLLPWFDVDDARSLRRLLGELGFPGPPSGRTARNTAAALRSLLAEAGTEGRGPALTAVA